MSPPEEKPLQTAPEVLESAGSSANDSGSGTTGKEIHLDLVCPSKPGVLPLMVCDPVVRHVRLVSGRYCDVVNGLSWRFAGTCSL